MKNKTTRSLLAKRFICLSVVCVMFLCSFTTAFAGGGLKVSKSYTGSFAKDWQKTATDTGASALYALKMTYGYNITAINEDYAYGEGTVTTKGYDHTAYVTNSNGTFAGSTVAYCYVSKIEVRHKGTTIKYKVTN